MKHDPVDNPSHYRCDDPAYECIKVIRAWDLPFALASAVKYIKRAGKKDGSCPIEDLEKAVWYLKNEIESLKCKQPEPYDGGCGHPLLESSASPVTFDGSEEVP